MNTNFVNLILLQIPFFVQKPEYSYGFVVQLLTNRPLDVVEGEHFDAFFIVWKKAKEEYEARKKDTHW